MAGMDDESDNNNSNAWLLLSPALFLVVVGLSLALLSGV